MDKKGQCGKIRLAQAIIRPDRKSKSKKSKKTLFNVGQCKQYNISSHLKWVLVADNVCHGTDE